MSVKNVFLLIVSIFIAQLAGVIGSIFTITSIQSWYAFLEKPFFAPPNWLFAPAWIILYTLMGMAAFLIWQRKGNLAARNYALQFYLLNLSLNTLWSIIFFGLRSPGLALAEIILLWIIILMTTLKFLRIDKLAGWLFMPYLLWVSFASVLNLFVYLLN